MKRENQVLSRRSFLGATGATPATFTISNIYVGPTSITAVTLGGANPKDFQPGPAKPRRIAVRSGQANPLRLRWHTICGASRAPAQSRPRPLWPSAPTLIE